MHVLAARIRAHAQDVALVGGDQAHLEMLEEAADGGKALALLLADLDGKRQEAPVRKAERDQGVRDVRPRPVRQRRVHRAQFVEVVAALLPLDRVVVIAAPVEIAHIVQGDEIALHRSP